MVKVHVEVVSVRMTLAMYDALEQVAVAHGLTTIDNKPNLGAAARMLLATSLDAGGGALIDETLKNNIRNEMLQRVNAATKRFINDLSEVMK